MGQALDFKIVEGMADSEYHAVAAVGGTLLGRAARTLADFREYELHPPAPSKQMALGSVIHSLLRGIGSFHAAYAVRPEGVDGRSKEGKAFAADAERAGKLIVDAADFADATRAVKNIYAHPIAWELLQGARHEVSAFWTDAESGLACKARYDLWRPDLGPLIADLKTSRDGTRHAFSGSVAQYHYEIQAAHYCDPVDAQLWVWIVVENIAPFNVVVYQASPTLLAIGAQRRRELLAKIADCRRTGNYPGFAANPQIIDLPKWATGETDNG